MKDLENYLYEKIFPLFLKNLRFIWLYVLESVFYQNIHIQGDQMKIAERQHCLLLKAALRQRKFFQRQQNRQHLNYMHKINFGHKIKGKNLFL
jgi:hypothetical protein